MCQIERERRMNVETPRFRAPLGSPPPRAPSRRQHSHFRRKPRGMETLALTPPAARATRPGDPTSRPPMRICLIVTALLACLLALRPCEAAFAQPAGIGTFHIVWEVKNRFRLFRNEADFLRQLAASRGDGILAAERRLERDSGGLGWAKDVVANLCLDDYGNLLRTCDRDGTNENYLTPSDYPVGVTVSGPVPQGATCTWSFDDGKLRQTSAPCSAEVKLRVDAARTTVATVDIPLGDGTAQQVAAEIATC